VAVELKPSARTAAVSSSSWTSTNRAQYDWISLPIVLPFAPFSDSSAGREATEERDRSVSCARANPHATDSHAAHPNTRTGCALHVGSGAGDAHPSAVVVRLRVRSHPGGAGRPQREVRQRVAQPVQQLDHAQLAHPGRAQGAEGAAQAQREATRERAATGAGAQREGRRALEVDDLAVTHALRVQAAAQVDRVARLLLRARAAEAASERSPRRAETRAQAKQARRTESSTLRSSPWRGHAARDASAQRGQGAADGACFFAASGNAAPRRKRTATTLHAEHLASMAAAGEAHRPAAASATSHAARSRRRGRCRRRWPSSAPLGGADEPPPRGMGPGGAERRRLTRHIASDTSTPAWGHSFSREGRTYPREPARGRDVLRRAKNTRSRRNSTRLRRAERYGVYRAPGARRGRHFPRRLDILERSAAGPARSAAPEMRLNVSQSAGGRAPASSSSARTRQPHNGTKNQAVPGLRAAPLRHIFGSKPGTALRLGPGHRHAAKNGALRRRDGARCPFTGLRQTCMGTSRFGRHFQV